MKNFALLLCLTLASVGIIYFVKHWPELETIHGSTNLLAGQELDIQNSLNVEIAVNSEYPVSVNGLGCRAFRVVSENLDCGPGRITIRDFRPGILIWAHSNRVNWSAKAISEDVEASADPQPIRAPQNPTDSRLRTEPSLPYTVDPATGSQPRGAGDVAEATPPDFNQGHHNVHRMQIATGQKEFDLRPGDMVIVSPAEMRSIKIASQAPIRVEGLHCNLGTVLNGECHDLESSILITDARTVTAAGTNGVFLTGLN